MTANVMNAMAMGYAQTATVIRSRPLGPILWSLRRNLGDPFDPKVFSSCSLRLIAPSGDEVKGWQEMKPFNHQSVVEQVPQLKRGQVWCHTCGHTERVDSAACLRSGWPTHCGETMSIDSPDERRERADGRS
jgi:hypothetical protein